MSCILSVWSELLLFNVFFELLSMEVPNLLRRDLEAWIVCIQEFCKPFHFMQIPRKWTGVASFIFGM